MFPPYPRAILRAAACGSVSEIVPVTDIVLVIALLVILIDNISILVLENELVNMSNNGISSKKNFLRFKEVLYSYKNIFGVFFFVPYTLRYIRRILIRLFKVK